MSPADRLHQEVSLSDDVYWRIKDYILSDAIRPPDRLQIGQLSRHFGVSITPIREALIRLAAEHIIELKPGRGFFYKEFLPAEQTKLYELLFCLLKYLLEKRGQKPLQLRSELPAPSILADAQDVSGSKMLAVVLAREKLYAQIAASSGNEQCIEMVSNLCERTRISRMLFLEQHSNETVASQDLRKLTMLLQSGENKRATDMLAEQFHAKMAKMYALANERQHRIYNAYPLLRPGSVR